MSKRAKQMLAWAAITILTIITYWPQSDHDSVWTAEILGLPTRVWVWVLGPILLIISIAYLLLVINEVEK